MCGIAGRLHFDENHHVSAPEIEKMLDALQHRGPDGRGLHLDGRVGLGHCRLSIIDLATGTQPMPNEDESIWIVFNGEIYNFQDLRTELIDRGHAFRSRSDTEVIVHLYEELGVDCVNRLRGMFAFALWDARQQRLLLARDRVGIKPLYYSQTSKGLNFASELKAIVADPAVEREVDSDSLREFFSFNYVPGEGTLFRNIRKLLPGHTLVCERGNVAINRYWDLRFTDHRCDLAFDAAATELNQLLARTVQDHMIADVPVGVLLSGGVDSSAVLSFAVAGSPKKVRTFTVGFDGEGIIDERPYARLTAERFGTEHLEITITADDFWNFLPSYVRHMEEPVCEPPAIALYYVSKLARNHVKVLLSGEGGDEAFAGYPNYPNMLRLQRVQRLLGPLARPIGSAVTSAGIWLGNGRMQRYSAALGRPLASQYFSRTSGPLAFFNRAATGFFSPEFLKKTENVSPQRRVHSLLDSNGRESLLDQMLYVDTKTWLPDDLLVKADKMTMANSVELRVPLLDHHVLEFAASLPDSFKVAGRMTKRVLKGAFAKVLPPGVLNRKKMGFPVPYERWLRRELRTKVEEILLSERTIGRGYLRRAPLERLLRDNARDGTRAKEVFSLLVAELWHRAFLDEFVHV